MRSPLFTLRGATRRALAWLSLLAISTGLAYLTTTAISARYSTTGSAMLADTPPLARTALTGVQAIERLRPMLASRGFGADIVNGPTSARAPGRTGAWAVDRIGDDFDPDMGTMLEPLQREAWLVFTPAGRWWLWEYGVAAPADRRALLAESAVPCHASPQGRGVD
ncbi:MAG TPA: hypothetical protein VGL99_09915 [Chloroflexota bacterium]|jgi:hypothetical protein